MYISEHAATHIEVEVDDERASAEEPGGRTNVARLIGRGDVESWRAMVLRPRTGDGMGGSGFTLKVLKMLTM